MARLTIIIGTLLVLAGLAFYAAPLVRDGTSPSVTALIPAFAGLPILLLGLVALRETVRMHAMHGVAVLSLLAMLLPLGRLGMQLARGAEVKPAILASLSIMAGLSGFLLVACIRSFIRARLNRAASG